MSVAIAGLHMEPKTHCTYRPSVNSLYHIAQQSTSQARKDKCCESLRTACLGGSGNLHDHFDQLCLQARHKCRVL